MGENFIATSGKYLQPTFRATVLVGYNYKSILAAQSWTSLCLRPTNTNITVKGLVGFKEPCFGARHFCLDAIFSLSCWYF